MPKIEQFGNANLQIYVADKASKQMNRESEPVARGTW